jgi:hypothetical protein
VEQMRGHSSGMAYPESSACNIACSSSFFAVVVGGLAMISNLSTSSHFGVDKTRVTA